MGTIEPVTYVNLTDCEYTDSRHSSNLTYNLYDYRYSTTRKSTPTRKIETKKERIKRIATEKMFASWKIHNHKTEHIIEIVQLCKPRHKFNHLN